MLMIASEIGLLLNESPPSGINKKQIEKTLNKNFNDYKENFNHFYAYSIISKFFELERKIYKETYVDEFVKDKKRENGSYNILDKGNYDTSIGSIYIINDLYTILGYEFNIDKETQKFIKEEIDKNADITSLNKANILLNQ